MENSTIVTSSPVGSHLNKIAESAPASYLMFNKKRIDLVAKITIGREYDNDVVVDNKLASRHHAVIQKIKDAFFIKDENSTNGTFVNNQRIQEVVILDPEDVISFGGLNFVFEL